MLKIDNITVQYGNNKPTIEDFNLEISSGEIVAIVGESGSGKTTVIRSVLGLLPGQGKVTKGDIVFEGDSLLKYTDKQWNQCRGTKMSMIFQDCGSMINPNRRIGSQFVEYIRVHENMPKDKAKEKAIEMLDRMRLPQAKDIMRKYPFQLSGGQRQRVGIAMAMTFQPKLLIADEPTSALDVTVQADILDMMKEIQKEHPMSIILITHDLGIVANFATDIIVMYAGKIVERGTSENIFYHPTHPYTKALYKALPNHEFKALDDKTQPLPSELPKGCVFCDRCKIKTKECEVRVPEIKEIRNGKVRCIHAT